LNKFVTDVKECKTLVAHNISSDLMTINKTLKRCEMNELKATTYCTMQNTKLYCKLQDKRGQLKSPKLSELYEIIFNERADTSKLHDSNYDVELCAKCYFEYLKKTKEDEKGDIN
jgi:DNA polymerase III alpha subunit (gram-positive type)